MISKPSACPLREISYLKDQYVYACACIYVCAYIITSSKNCGSPHRKGLVSVPVTTGNAVSRCTLSQVIHS